MAQVKQGLKDMNPTEMAQYGEGVVMGMTDNENFATPSPLLSSLTQQIAVVRAADGKVASSEAQLSNDRADLRAQTTVLQSLLSAEGTTVQSVADAVERAGGDPDVVIKSANMSVKAASTPIGQLGAPDNLQLNNADIDGEISCHCKAVKGAKSYAWETCEGDDPIAGVWGSTKVSSSASTLLKGYASGFACRRSARAIFNPGGARRFQSSWRNWNDAGAPSLWTTRAPARSQRRHEFVLAALSSGPRRCSGDGANRAARRRAK